MARYKPPMPVPVQVQLTTAPEDTLFTLIVISFAGLVPPKLVPGTVNTSPTLYPEPPTARTTEYAMPVRATVNDALEPEPPVADIDEYDPVVTPYCTSDQAALVCVLAVVVNPGALNVKRGSIIYALVKSSADAIAVPGTA